MRSACDRTVHGRVDQPDQLRAEDRAGCRRVGDALHAEHVSKILDELSGRADPEVGGDQRFFEVVPRFLIDPIATEKKQQATAQGAVRAREPTPQPGQPALRRLRPLHFRCGDVEHRQVRGALIVFDDIGMSPFDDAYRRVLGLAAVSRGLSCGSIGAWIQPRNVPTAAESGLSTQTGDHTHDDEGRQNDAADDEPQCRSIHPDILGALDQPPRWSEEARRRGIGELGGAPPSGELGKPLECEAPGKSVRQT